MTGSTDGARAGATSVDRPRPRRCRRWSAPPSSAATGATATALMREMQHRFHIHGRTGPVSYALSAVEIALWDLAGKRAGQPIATLLGGAPRTPDAYASLLRHAEPPLVAAAVERALA